MKMPYTQKTCISTLVFVGVIGSLALLTISVVICKTTTSQSYTLATEAIASAYDLFNKHFAILLSAFGAFGTLIGIVLPCYIEWLRKKNREEDIIRFRKDLTEAKEKIIGNCKKQISRSMQEHKHVVFNSLFDADKTMVKNYMFLYSIFRNQYKSQIEQRQEILKMNMSLAVAQIAQGMNRAVQSDDISFRKYILWAKERIKFFIQKCKEDELPSLKEVCKDQQSVKSLNKAKFIEKAKNDNDFIADINDIFAHIKGE